MSTSRDLTPRPFLTAEWRYLALLNYEIDPGLLQPLVPAGTELDDWRGRTFFSVVSSSFSTRGCLASRFRFTATSRKSTCGSTCAPRPRGLAPGGRLHPRTGTARGNRFHGAHRLRGAVPGRADDARHRVRERPGRSPTRVVYAWRFNGRETLIDLRVQGDAQALEPGSQEEFIAEHYWGYTHSRTARRGSTRVEHAPWRVWTGAGARLDCDAAGLYEQPVPSDCLQSAFYGVRVSGRWVTGDRLQRTAAATASLKARTLQQPEGLPVSSVLLGPAGRGVPAGT